MSTSNGVDVVISVNKISRKSGNENGVQLTAYCDRSTVDIHRYVSRNHILKTRRKGDAISVEHLQALGSLVHKVFKRAQREGLPRKKG